MSLKRFKLSPLSRAVLIAYSTLAVFPAVNADNNDQFLAMRDDEAHATISKEQRRLQYPVPFSNT